MRTENIAKGNFCFAPALYLGAVLQGIEKKPQGNFEGIIEKYVEMDVAHPFREDNGRSTHIWLDIILKKVLRRVVDQNSVDREEYLCAMERSPVKDAEIKTMMRTALADQIDD